MITFTRHARYRLKERMIEEDEVIRVLMRPERRFYDLRNGYQIAIGPRRKEELHLIIAYDQERKL